MNRKIIIRWVKVIVLVYCVIGIAVYYGQDRLLLHPVTIAPSTPFTFRQPFAELNLNYDTVTNLNVVQFKATDRPADSTAKGVVLFFHDRSGNIASYAFRSAAFTDQGYELWIMDYPGFGKSTGGRTEQQLYAYALVFYKLARSRWKPSEIVIDGDGFGSGIAAQLAAVRNCRRLILEHPYHSMEAHLRPYLFMYPLGMMLHYHFPVYRYLPEVTDPVTIVDGNTPVRL